MAQKDIEITNLTLPGTSLPKIKLININNVKYKCQRMETNNEDNNQEDKRQDNKNRQRASQGSSSSSSSALLSYIFYITNF